MKKIILASSSPRRHDLLQRLLIPFDVIFPNVDESIISPDGCPKKYCTSLAKLKAEDISQHFPNEMVIGADTIVVQNGKFLGKPDNEIQAQNMLQFLSGNTHQVYSGVCLKWTNKNIHHLFTEVTTVKFRDLDRKEISHYINNCSPLDKAGAYAIQDWSAIFVKEINGCYDNVVGLPLSRIYQELKNLEINLLDTISETS